MKGAYGRFLLGADGQAAYVWESPIEGPNAPEGKVGLVFEDRYNQYVGSVVVEPRPTLLRWGEKELR